MKLGKSYFIGDFYMNKNIKRIMNGAVIGGVLGAIIQFVTGGVNLTFKGAVISPNMPTLISISAFIGIVYALSGIISDY